MCSALLLGFSFFVFFLSFWVCGDDFLVLLFSISLTIFWFFSAKVNFNLHFHSSSLWMPKLCFADSRWSPSFFPFLICYPVTYQLMKMLKVTESFLNNFQYYFSHVSLQINNITYHFISTLFLLFQISYLLFPSTLFISSKPNTPYSPQNISNSSQFYVLCCTQSIIS